MFEGRDPHLEDRLEQSIDRAIRYWLETQDARGAWGFKPDPRLFETSLVAYVLSRVDTSEAQAAVLRARPWCQKAEPQQHDPHARLIDETPRRLLERTGDAIDLQDPVLYGNLLHRKALLLYVLGLHAGVEVLSPYTPAQVKEKLRRFFQESGTITMKRWSKVDLISCYAIVERLDGNLGAAAQACQRLAPMQTEDGSFCHNAVSTALAFIALSGSAPGSLTWKRCLEHLIAAQQEDGTWRFCSSDIWDTTLTLRPYLDHPSFVDAAARATRFLVEVQNSDGGWGYRIDMESDNDTSACALLALARAEGQDVARSIERGVTYLLGQQRQDGLWSTWQSSEDEPVEDCIAHVIAALAAFCGTHSPQIRTAQRWLEEQYRKNGRFRAGWYRNLPYSTLEAVRALGSSHPFSYAAVASLHRTQNADHGFSPEPGEATSVAATGLAVAALVEHWDIHEPFIRGALNWLFDAQLPDGSWTGLPEMYGPRPLLYNLGTHHSAFAGYGLMAAWRRSSRGRRW